MTRDQLTDRALCSYPGGAARFDPITLLILGAILSTVISHYVEKWLTNCENRKIRNPSVWAAFQLRWRVQRAWRSPAVMAAIGDRDPATLDREHGEDVAAALLAMVRGMSEAEIAAALGRPA